MNCLIILYFRPVLLSKNHIVDESDLTDFSAHVDTDSNCDYIVQPMRWGLVPAWHKGEISAISYAMNNARSESMLEKKSFKVPLVRGRRCVVLADGCVTLNYMLAYPIIFCRN